MSRSLRDEYECYKTRRRKVARRGPELGARDFDRLLRRHDQLQLRDIERGLCIEDRARLAELTHLLLLDRSPESCMPEESDDGGACDAAEFEMRDAMLARDELHDGDPRNLEEVRTAIDDSLPDDVVHDAGCDAHDELRDEASVEDSDGVPCPNASRLGNPIPSATTRRLRWRLGRRGSRT